MRTIYSALSIAALSLLGVSHADEAVHVPAYISKALANPSRPERDKARDADRKPGEVLTFAGVKPGQKIGELMPGNGYFTRIFCQVVGSKGHVYTVSIPPAIKTDRQPPPDTAAPNPCTNVTAESKSAAEMAFPAGLDVIWTSENYHDLHNAFYGSPDMKQFDTTLFNALKPGGILIVEDHAAEAASGARDTDTLHRIDSELVKREIISVGFKLIGSSDVLTNAQDPHTAKVFEMKGKSDKFLLKFQKPAK